MMGVFRPIEPEGYSVLAVLTAMLSPIVITPVIFPPNGARGGFLVMAMLVKVLSPIVIIPGVFLPVSDILLMPGESLAPAVSMKEAFPIVIMPEILMLFLKLPVMFMPGVSMVMVIL
ncbi:MAG: hypothetical protein LBB91_11045 [Clostridiales bacterium]|jgi:hypothetical protein|nr:hypothetical protein [Clostridiales bacterium]